MAKWMKGIAAASVGLTALLALWHRFDPSPWLLALAITAGTTAYHFCMRLAVGGIIHAFMKKSRRSEQKMVPARSF